MCILKLEKSTGTLEKVRQHRGAIFTLLSNSIIYWMFLLSLGRPPYYGGPVVLVLRGGGGGCFTWEVVSCN